MKKKAIVIGANQNGLKYAKRDAERVASALTDRGYNVKADKLFNLPVDKFIPELKCFLKDLTYKDQVLFYFAGHGILENHTSLHFALESSNINDSTTYIGAKEVSAVLEQCAARNKIVILDSCHAGAFSKDFKHDMNRVNYALIYACEGWERAIETEKELEGGLFTNLFLEALSGECDDALNKRNELTPSSLNNWLSSKTSYFQLHNVGQGRVELNDGNSGKLVIASFEDEDKQLPIQNNPNFFIDVRDEQSYPLLEVGDLTWMIKDFSYLDEKKQYTSRVTYINDEDRTSVLYTYDQAKDICPNGWRIPSLIEWKALVNWVYGKPSKKVGLEMMPEKIDIIPSGCLAFDDKIVHSNSSFFWTSDKATKSLCKVFRYDFQGREWNVDLCNLNWKISCRFVKNI